jgi:hypothetical protein
LNQAVRAYDKLIEDRLASTAQRTRTSSYPTYYNHPTPQVQHQYPSYTHSNQSMNGYHSYPQTPISLPLSQQQPQPQPQQVQSYPQQTYPQTQTQPQAIATPAIQPMQQPQQQPYIAPTSNVGQLYPSQQYPVPVNHQQPPSGHFTNQTQSPIAPVSAQQQQQASAHQNLHQAQVTQIQQYAGTIPDTSLYYYNNTESQQQHQQQLQQQQPHQQQPQQQQQQYYNKQPVEEAPLIEL